MVLVESAQLWLCPQLSLNGSKDRNLPLLSAWLWAVQDLAQRPMGLWVQWSLWNMVSPPPFTQASSSIRSAFFLFYSLFGLINGLRARTALRKTATMRRSSSSAMSKSLIIFHTGCSYWAAFLCIWQLSNTFRTPLKCFSNVLDTVWVPRVYSMLSLTSFQSV